MANAAPGRYFPEVIYGHKGTIVFERGRIAVVPEPTFAPAGVEGGIKAAKYIETPASDIQRSHTDNFLACMRSRQQPILGPDLGYQIMAAIKLGVDSYRQGKVMFFDPAAKREVKRGPARPAYEGRGENFSESE